MAVQEQTKWSYIDDVSLFNISKLSDFIDYIYPIELEIKDTTDKARPASYLNLHIEFYSEERLRTTLYVK